MKVRFKLIVFCCATFIICLVGEVMGEVMGEGIARPVVEVTALPTAAITITAVATPQSVGSDILLETPKPSAVEVNDTPARAEQDVVVVSPGVNLLPAPKIDLVTPRVVSVSMPEVTVQLSDEQIERAARVLRRRFAVSREKARELLYHPGNFRVLYIVKVESPRVRGQFKLLNFVKDRAASRDSRIRQIRSRLTTVTLRRLKVGQRYRISYSVEIILKSPRLVIGRTASSPSVTLRH